MKTTFIIISFLAAFCCCSISAIAQNSVADLDINEYPQYIIITTENTKFLGGIDITIDYKKSKYKDQLETLERVLQSRKKMRIRNQTDLLNAMWEFGFDFVDAFNANAETLGGQVGDTLEGTASESKFRVNMVFRKK